MLRCTGLRVSRSARGCLRNCVTRAAAGAPAIGRAVLEDVERLTRGEAAKRRGTGSRAVPHRLNADERALWDLAKVRVHVRRGLLQCAVRQRCALWLHTAWRRNGGSWCSAALVTDESARAAH